MSVLIVAKSPSAAARAGLLADGRNRPLAAARSSFRSAARMPACWTDARLPIHLKPSPSVPLSSVPPSPGESRLFAIVMFRGRSGLDEALKPASS
jgi:hypothetical protein